MIPTDADMPKEKTIHMGRNVKRFREMFNLKQDIDNVNYINFTHLRFGLNDHGIPRQRQALTVHNYKVTPTII